MCGDGHDTIKKTFACTLQAKVIERSSDMRSIRSSTFVSSRSPSRYCTSLATFKI